MSMLVLSCEIDLTDINLPPACFFAAGTLPSHLANILSTTLALMSTNDTTPAATAAPTTALQVCLAAGEDGAHLVVSELLKALEDPTRRKGAADLAAAYAKASKVDLQEHVDPMLGVSGVQGSGCRVELEV